MGTFGCGGGGGEGEGERTTCRRTENSSAFTRGSIALVK